ncbi:MAG: dTMP kinase, partial [Limisphaerales bacterium]
YTTDYNLKVIMLDLKMVREIVEVAVGETKPDLTLLLMIPPEISEFRRAMRQATLPFIRDRIEESNAEFFARVDKGYQAIAESEQARVREVDASGSIEGVRMKVLQLVQAFLAKFGG